MGLFKPLAILSALALFSVMAVAQNLEIGDDPTSGGSISSNCLGDCYLDTSAYAGGTTIFLHRGSSVVGTLWVDADLGDSVVTGDLAPPTTPPPENGTIIRTERFFGFNNGGFGDWEVIHEYTYTQGLLTSVEVRSVWRPECVQGLCDGDDNDGADDSGG